MTWPKNAMDVFKLLDKSNCRECGAPTCLAFAAAVFKGEQRLNECPRVDQEVLDQYDGQPVAPKGADANMEAQLAQLKQSVQDIDLTEASKRTGGRCTNGKLTVKIMGKDFSVDAQGNLSSDIHVHNWIAGPFFDYIHNCQGAPISGKWVPFRELENGKDWARFFNHRCEKRLKKVADTYTDLFEDMVHLFNGRPVEHHYQSDISLVLHPLPKLPLLICYWKPEEGMDSDLNVFFDANAEKNLSIGSIYTLGVGLVLMFEKIALRHGVVVEG